MRKVKVTEDDVFDFNIVYHEDLPRNPQQIDLNWMLHDLSQFANIANEEIRFEALFYTLINQ